MDGIEGTKGEEERESGFEDMSIVQKRVGTSGEPYKQVWEACRASGSSRGGGFGVSQV